MIPSFTCSAVRTDDPSQTTPIDFSSALVNLDHHRAADLLTRLGARETIYAQDISGSIPETWRQHFWASNVRIPDMYDRASEFIAAIRGVSGLRSWQALARARQEAQWNVTSARKLRKVVKAARFVPLSQSTAAMLFDDIGGTYANDADEAIDRTFSHDDLVAAVGHPVWDGPDSIREDYTRRSDAWVRSNACPFAFSTEPRKWAGVTNDDLLAILEDEPEIAEAQFLDRAWTGLESDLSDNHYEEAHEAIRKRDDLSEALIAWLAAHRSTGDATKAFDAVRSWNEGQQIVSYFPDMTAVVGLFSDVNPQEVHVWVDRHTERAEKAVEAVNALWRPDILDPETETASAAALGISLLCEPKRSSHQTWRWINDATGESSPKFLTLELCVEALPSPVPETGKAA